MLLAIGLSSSAPVAWAQGGRTASEDQIKAALIFRIANFVSWPDSTFEDESSPFMICIVGNDNVYDALSASLKTKRIGGRRIAVERRSVADDVTDCNLVFIAKSARQHTPDIIDETMDKPVLTIGDAEDFTEVGGIIQLVEKRGRLALEVQMDAAERANLTIKADLLSHATIVHDR